MQNALKCQYISGIVVSLCDMYIPHNFAYKYTKEVLCRGLDEFFKLQGALIWKQFERNEERNTFPNMLLKHGPFY